MMHVGFTGTRNGMTFEQQATVRNLLLYLIEQYGRITVHHGACVGADAQFHNLCMGLGIGIAQIHQHIPRDQRLRAHLQGGLFEAPLDYEDRNRAIVDASNHIIAAPYESEPQLRGGTWQTVRFAKAKDNLWRVVYPNGAAIPW